MSEQKEGGAKEIQLETETQEKIYKALIASVRVFNELDPAFREIPEDIVNLKIVAISLSRGTGKTWKEKVDSVLEPYIMYAKGETKERLPELRTIMIDELKDAFGEQ